MAERTWLRERAGSPLAALARKLSRFGALSADEKVLFAEAWVRIALARVFARRPRSLHAAMDARGRDGEREAGRERHDLARLERLFLLAARHQPGMLGCVPRSHALHGFLAGRGHAAKVRIGVRRDARGQLEGHAWAEVGGCPVAERMSGGTFVALRLP